MIKYNFFRKTYKSLLIFSLLFAFSFTSCSSAPKRSMMETTVYNSAASMLESANAAILLGDYSNANVLLQNAYNKSMSIDNYDLLTSVLLARVSLELSYNPAKIDEAKQALEQAQFYAQFSDFAEKQKALCVLNEVRITIADSETTANLSSLQNMLEENKKAIKGDAYNEAHFEAAAGDIYKMQGKYEAAENAYLTATKSFTDNRYLSEIGINWYKVAQVRSLNGNKDGALDALENAIKYDRLAENTIALASDYWAKGTVLLKGTPSPEQKKAAEFAFEHSKDILDSAAFN